MNEIQIQINIEDGVCECGDNIVETDVNVHFETKHHKDYLTLKSSIARGLATAVQVGIAS